jgi:hypothetical protein
MEPPRRPDGPLVHRLRLLGGSYAFEAEQRRATRVLATDWFSWHGRGGGNKEGFLVAREILGSKVEDMDIAWTHAGLKPDQLVGLSPNSVLGKRPQRDDRGLPYPPKYSV